MNYRKHYDNLIKKSLSRNLHKSIYVEQHHIIPKCLGGVNRKSNIVSLLPHEHFVAHQLLVRIHPTHAGLKYALYKMTLNTQKMKRNNKQYSWIKKELSIANSINAKSRWLDNKMERTAYSARTKKQWNDMTDEEYKTACNVRSENQTGLNNSFSGKKHKTKSKDILSAKKIIYFQSMTDSERLEKIPQLRQVSVNGIVYPGLSFAARKLNIGSSLLHYRINSKSEKWKEYLYI